MTYSITTRSRARAEQTPVFQPEGHLRGRTVKRSAPQEGTSSLRARRKILKEYAVAKLQPENQPKTPVLQAQAQAQAQAQDQDQDQDQDQSQILAQITTEPVVVRVIKLDTQQSMGEKLYTTAFTTAKNICQLHATATPAHYIANKFKCLHFAKNFIPHNPKLAWNSVKAQFILGLGKWAVNEFTEAKESWDKGYKMRALACAGSGLAASGWATDVALGIIRSYYPA